MKKVLHWLDHNLEGFFLIIIMAYFAFATFAQVVCRVGLKISVPWTEESARYALIWMVFLGCSYAAQQSSHIRIDILESAVGTKAGWYVKQISMLLFVVFTLIMTFVGIKLCVGLVERPQTSAVLKLNMIYVYASLPVGMGLTSFRVIQNMVKDFKSRKQKGE